ncbi:MAG: DUF749 family protein [Methanobacteriaceae archaeon]|nr:DUF749 family protein [Methanobacteriaceae archaeon]
MFIMELIGIFNKKDVPEEYESFVSYKANMDNKTIKDNDQIAILRIANTQSYHVLFLDLYNNMGEIEKELEEKVDGKIFNFNTKNIIEGHLNGK